MSKGKWVVMTEKEIQFSIKCQNGSSFSVSTSPPVSTLSLSSQCKALSSDLFLPQYFDMTLNYAVDSFLETDTIQVTSFSVSNIWDKFHVAFGNQSSIHVPRKLKNLRDVPLESLIHQVRQLGDNLPDGEISSYITTKLPLIIGSSSAILVMAPILPCGGIHDEGPSSV